MSHNERSDPDSELNALTDSGIITIKVAHDQKAQNNE